jgi:hypothetical protein
MEWIRSDCGILIGRIADRDPLPPPHEKGMEFYRPTNIGSYVQWPLEDDVARAYPPTLCPKFLVLLGRMRIIAHCASYLLILLQKIRLWSRLKNMVIL